MSNQHQIISKLGREFRVWRGVDDHYWDTVDSPRWEPGTYQTFNAFLRPSDTFLDVGAYLGATLLYAANSCETAIGVEADPLNHGELQRNISANPNLTNVSAHWYALAKERGHIELSSATESVSTQSSAVSSSPIRQWTVPSFSFKDLALFTQRDINFIKIDIEGAEYSICNELLELLATSVDITIFLALHPHIISPAAAGHKWSYRNARALLHRYMHTIKVYRMIVNSGYDLYFTDRKRRATNVLFQLANMRRPYEIVLTKRTPLTS